MTVTWLIEAGVYGSEVTPLVQEIRRQGMVGAVISHQALRKGSTPAIGGQALAPDACVIGYGTYPFAQQLLLHHAFVPGAWCSAQNLDCAVYFAHFGRYLLNQPHAILPGVEALRNCDALYSAYGVDERVFARPTSSHKLFVGRCIERQDFATALAPTRYDPTALVVVAAPRPIEREWRLVVIDHRQPGRGGLSVCAARRTLRPRRVPGRGAGLCRVDADGGGLASGPGVRAGRL